jgi:hypothetical protein
MSLRASSTLTLRRRASVDNQAFADCSPLFHCQMNGALSAHVNRDDVRVSPESQGENGHGFAAQHDMPETGCKKQRFGLKDGSPMS